MSTDDVANTNVVTVWNVMLTVTHPSAPIAKYQHSWNATGPIKIVDQI